MRQHRYIYQEHPSVKFAEFADSINGTSRKEPGLLGHGVDLLHPNCALRTYSPPTLTGNCLLITRVSGPAGGMWDKDGP